MHRIISITMIAVLLGGCDQQGTPGIDLSGEWQFCMDPEDRGESEEWFNRELDGMVRLPGSMAENGKGYDIDLQTQWTGGIQNTEWYLDSAYAPFHDPDNIRFPYWLQPVKKYTGAAWYRRTFDLPDDWTGKMVFLELERPHWESTIWVNGQRAGMENSLATSHVFDITQYVKEGTNTLAIRIDNRTKSIDVGENSHSITDHTQSNWNGIAGRLAITGRSRVCFTRIDVFPDVASGKVRIRASILNASPDSVRVKIPVAAGLKDSGRKSEKRVFGYVAPPGESEFSMDYHPGEEILAWDEFEPFLYRMDIVLQSKYGPDERTVEYGYREFKTEGSRFTINGHPVFLRGTLECAIFPKTGYPPTDVEGWSKIFDVIRAHGLNHMRFHSWCPPEAAFTAADRAGVYLQVECSSWANQSTQLGSGLPVDDYIRKESERIVRAYGNHPSFALMAYGNEPGGPNYSTYLTEFVQYWKEADSRRVYTGAAGWPVIEANEYHNIPEPRIQGWGEELGSIINALPPSTDFDWRDRLPGDGKPVVSHEIGQWCVYPDFGEIEKYTGVLKARNFELFRESLEANHMGHLARNFLMASGKLQALCYKADIEAALRTPGFAGFQLLDLHDFPGQGTALVGVLNPFWEEKGYISAEEYSRFCNVVVPLARFRKLIFTEGEIVEASIEVSHFGPEEVMRAEPFWELTRDGAVVAEGSLGLKEIHRGNGIPLGEVVFPLEEVKGPAMLTLEVKVGEYANSWDIWVYPAAPDIRSDKVRVVEKMDPDVMDHLKKGGKVLLSLGKGKVSDSMGGEVGVGFSSIFWNTAWTGNQKPHTLGILCNPDHPALKEFPTAYHSNWQWWDAMSHADAIQIDSFPPALEPVVRIIDDWVTNRRLALILEAKVGKGKLLISGIDLVNGLENRPEARQLRYSLLKYMEGEQFNPDTELSIGQVLHIPKQAATGPLLWNNSVIKTEKENEKTISMNMIQLMKKRILLDSSAVLFEKTLVSDDLEALFTLHHSRWEIKDGWLEGENRGNWPGMAILKQDFPGNVLVEFDAQTILPSTHDINVMWNGEWLADRDQRGIAYVAGLQGWWTGKVGIEKSNDYRFMVGTPLLDFVPGKIYRIQAGSIDGHCFILADGKLLLEAMDPDPIDSRKYTKVGFEAYCSHIRIRNIRIRQIYWEPAEMSYEAEF